LGRRGASSKKDVQIVKDKERESHHIPKPSMPHPLLLGITWGTQQIS